MSLEVVKPGLLSTFQDLGRIGSQAIGMPVCGAMDPLSHGIANLIAGNTAEEATLEITLMGPSLRFGRDSLIALAGADLSPTLQPAGTDAATPIPMLQPVHVPAGALLQFGKRRGGLRSYLALAGGFGLPAAMGSRSTYLRGALGGFQGRALRKGDVIALPAFTPGAPTVVTPTASALLHGLLERGAAGATVRIVEGPEWPQFTDASHRTLLSEDYRIGSQSDRMGYRLEGPVLQRTAPRDMLSEAVAFGTMQVPPDGQPIVLMADRQTSGGYPRIAQVAGVDLPLLAQRMPGESIRFERIALEAAQRLLQRRASAMASLARALRA
ncbi:urea carboxylase [Variovorax paradoxus]|uniref:5-oxoprolinase subunit C family protein n=1 Tax=Variovorax atrisoli TaxID=3394203 RepID=UPI001199A39B|nr:biotin-dependent carboxyltransferase family protein [Variovorax paradoxus]MDR6524120.1 urea carboxylase [Variovorax paradoxus]